MPEQELDKTPTGDEEARWFSNMDNALLYAEVLKNRQYLRDMKNREEYANKAFALTVVWVCFILLLTALQFFKGWIIKVIGPVVGLDSNEFIAVISSTTVTVLGFWLLVGRYLFHRADEKPKKKDE